MKIERPLFIPIFSMRSYETGQYAVLKDGNFQLVMARAMASNFSFIHVAIPEDCSDEAELRELYQGRDLGHKSINFVKMKYGKNAVETREQFWKLNAKEIYMWEMSKRFDIIVSDITGYKKHEFGFQHVIYNFNITKLPELDRPYIDKFFETDLKSIEDSLFTTVINPRQREYILEVRPDLINKVIAHTKIAHERMLPKGMAGNNPAKMIFWPFRISDKAYEWIQFLEAFEEQGLDKDGWIILATDPNDTLETDASFVMQIKPTKEEYYQILAARPIIVMLDDIDTVLHPGTIEFLHYKCPIITYKSKLIDNPNAIGNLNQLDTALDNLRYTTIDASPFVYGLTEVDQYLNTTYIDVLSN